MKTRLTALILAALMCTGLCACGSKAESPSQSAAAPSASSAGSPNKAANTVTVGIAQDLDNSLEDRKTHV